MTPNRASERQSGFSQSCRIVHVGQTGSYERTDPDYDEKRLARLANDYKECPKEWRSAFIDGLPNSDIKALRERKAIPAN